MSLIAKIKRRLFRPSETIDGYEHPELVDVIFRKTLAYEPVRDWPEMRGVTSVLDFGGGFGKHYKEANTSARWAVVETASIVERASELTTDRLRFFSTIAEASHWLGAVEVVHSDGAIQYTPEPLSIVRDLCSVGAKKMLWYRLLFSIDPKRETQTSYLTDNGPPVPIDRVEKIARYTRTGITETDFIASHEGYAVDDRGKDWFHFKSRAGFY